MGTTSPPTPSNPDKGLGFLDRLAAKKEAADKAKDAADKALKDQKPPKEIRGSSPNTMYVLLAHY